jgi:flavin-dependent dehydrogenase
MKMSKYIKKKGLIELHYGWNDSTKEYYYFVYDLSRKNINGGLVDYAGSKSTMMPLIVLAEKLKKFDAPIEHIQKILYMRKI